jgi:hypothetical protein
MAKAICGFIIAISGLGVGLLVLEGEGLTVTIIAGLSAVVLAVAVVAGRLLIGSKPVLGGLLMELILVLQLFVAIGGAAVALWLAVEHAPSDDAGARAKIVYANIVGAVSALVGGFAVDVDQPWLPSVRAAVKKLFAESFRDRRDAVEKDAHDAVIRGQYGSQAHSGELVDGWTWRSRRLRLRHLQRAVELGYAGKSKSATDSAASA